jgi:hypothetical protein
MTRPRILAILFLSFTLPAFVAAAQSGTENLLLPVAGRLPGAHGSEWVTELTLTNMSDTEVFVGDRHVDVCTFSCPLSVPPRSTIVIEDVTTASNVRGRLTRIEQGRIGDLAMTLRTRDLSRQFETWGTVIPVIARADLFSQRFGIVDVPVEPQFRAMLRIYDFDAQTPGAVRVRVYALHPRAGNDQQPDSDTLLLDIQPTFAISPGEESIYPGSIELPLWLDPALLNAGHVRIQIDPLDETGDYWAFVSVTHNDTQHVSVLTSQ